MKTFAAALVVFAIGIGLAWVGYNQTQSQEVTCSGELMSPGDLCEYNDGTLNTYDEEKAGLQSGGWVVVGIGGLVTVVGVFVLVGVVTRQRRPATAG